MTNFEQNIAKILISCFLQQKELMEAGRKQLEQLVQVSIL
jgi:hypothetical protein